LRPGGRAFFIYNRWVPEGSAPTDDANAQLRRLDDGREYKVVKIYYEPAELAAKLDRLGWTCKAQATDTFFI
jgi:demethylmenaquinone methyltransferase/2-methoxy-6-polyprenyl-1,4-benzoquinol methylase